LISVRSEVQILPGPPLTQRCASQSEDAALGQARARLFLNRAAHAGGASTAAAARRNQGCAGGVAQLGERLLCKQEVIGSIPFTSTTDRTMRSNVRVKARQRRSCAARAQSATAALLRRESSKRDSGALAPRELKARQRRSCAARARDARPGVEPGRG
jgi:hypothetical protein